MKRIPKSLTLKLEQREQNNSLRKLALPNHLIDFASNDYLGFSKSEAIFNETHSYLIDNSILQNGATGSRLLSGNHSVYKEVENYIAKFHQVESTLIFCSGYDANVGFFGSVPQRNDIILFDELSHASIRDGIQLSNAKSYKFQHNDFEDLERLIQKLRPKTQDLKSIYIVTESIFSMDGDTPNREELVALCDKYGCFLVIDEAHALGVFGDPEVSGGKPTITCYISKELVAEKSLNAGNVVRELGKYIQGGGGGQPFFATAGGKNTAGIAEALEKAIDFIK